MQLTTEGVAAWPAAAPDGRSIVYSREGSGLWRVGVDGQNARPIEGTTSGNYPTITPDNRTILFTGGLSGADGAIGGSALLSVPAAGGTPRSIFDAGTTGSRAAVSPDGKQIALYYHERGGATYLVVMPIDGTRPTKQFDVAPSIAYSAVRWTADGKALLHNSAVDDRANIWLQPLEGGAPRKVTHFSDQAIFAFDRSADGKTLIIARGTLTRDAVLIRNFR
jgi:Tol biopolymer transport system component